MNDEERREWVRRAEQHLGRPLDPAERAAVGVRPCPVAGPEWYCTARLGHPGDHVGPVLG